MTPVQPGARGSKLRAAGSGSLGTLHRRPRKILMDRQSNLVAGAVGRGGVAVGWCMLGTNVRFRWPASAGL